MVFVNTFINLSYMYLHRKLEYAELIDLLVIHTNRLIQITIYGETYNGEYEVCKRTIELVQNEITSRQSSPYKLAYANGR
jgi:hypothetical protein